MTAKSTSPGLLRWKTIENSGENFTPINLTRSANFKISTAPLGVHPNQSKCAGLDTPLISEIRCLQKNNTNEPLKSLHPPENAKLPSLQILDFHLVALKDFFDAQYRFRSCLALRLCHIPSPKNDGRSLKRVHCSLSRSLKESFGVWKQVPDGPMSFAVSC